MCLNCEGAQLLKLFEFGSSTVVMCYSRLTQVLNAWLWARCVLLLVYVINKIPDSWGSALLPISVGQQPLLEQGHVGDTWGRASWLVGALVLRSLGLLTQLPQCLLLLWGVRRDRLAPKSSALDRTASLCTEQGKREDTVTGRNGKALWAVWDCCCRLV